jgi:hypothetical protein
MARYFNPTPSQYVSQFVPPNLDLMYKVAQEKAANDAALSDSLDKAEQDWKVKGGLFTNKQDAELFNQEVESNLSKIKDNFYSGNMDSFQASRALNRLQNVVKNNNKYRLYKLDEQYTKALQPSLAAGKLNEGLGVNIGGGKNSIDLRGGQLIVNTQIDPNATSEEQLATWYNAQTPGDFVNDHKEIYEQFKPRINEALTKNYGNKAGFTTIAGKPVFYDGSGKDITKEVTEKMMLPLVINYARENYNKTSKPSVEYMRREGLNEIDYAKRILNSFLGYGVYEQQMGDINYSPISTGSDKEEKIDYTAYVSTPGMPVKPVGGNGTEIKSNFQSFLIGKKGTSLTEQGKGVPMGAPGVGGAYMTTGSDFKWSDLNDKEKNVIAQYFEIKNMPEFAEKIKKGQVYGKDTKLVYNKKNIGTMGDVITNIINSGYLDRLNDMPIVANEIVGNEIDYNAFGIKTSSTSAPSVFDLLSSKLKDAQTYDPENGSLTKFSEIFENQQNLKDIPVGIYNISADNNLKTLTGTKENWGNAVKVQVGDKSYYLTGYKYASENPEVNAYLQIKSDVNNIVNEIENLRYSLPGSKVNRYGDDGKKNGYILYDDVNKEFVATDLKGNEVQRSTNAYFTNK